MDFLSFYRGTCFNAFEYLGAHHTTDGVVFRTYAPNARAVTLLLEQEQIPMAPETDGKFFVVTVPHAKPGDAYEYRIHFADGSFCDHADPYGFGMEVRPAHRSVVRDILAYTFHDQAWMHKRSDCKNGPLNIYEMHLGSWHKNEDDWYRYDELAVPLIHYLKTSGYNYVEFMPLSEHPSDESWGYQNTGFFAPTARYGRPQDLMRLIDLLHQNDIGVILDFVPVHFALDAYGLKQYDGTQLYEYSGDDMNISEWGSCNFVHGKGEVNTFLQSSAHFWMQHYHFDGLRMDAISRMIYWHGDENRGENVSAIRFLQFMNQGLKSIHPSCMLIAEDSTNYPKVTAPVEEGGLGFDYKWNMGWMHDTLDYFQTPPWERSVHYHRLTFSMLYYYNEHFLLPFSHDEVVHGKLTILQKMFGRYEEKFPQARAMYLYMMLHPGKKLNFMGNEIGQFREWDEKKEQDWFMLRYPIHDAFYHYMCALNQLYLAHPALSAGDYEVEGFRWLDCHQEARCIYAIERTDGEETLAAVFNFSGIEQRGYALPLPAGTRLQLLLHTDWQRFNGETVEDAETPDSTALCLPPFSGMLFQVLPPAPPTGETAKTP